MSKKITLEEILNLHTVPDLKEMAKGVGLKGYSKWKKADFIEALKQNFLNENDLKIKFLAATQREISLLESAINTTVIVGDDIVSYLFWVDLHIAFITEENEVHIPMEVQEVYNKVKENSIFKKTQSSNFLIDQYVLACTNLYSIIELNKFIEIIKAQTKAVVDEESVISWCTLRYMWCEKPEYIYQDGYIMDSDFDEQGTDEWEDYKELLEMQKGKPYFVPEKEELLKYVDLIYVDQNPAFQVINSFMKNQLGMDEENAFNICAYIQLQFRDGGTIADVINDCLGLGVAFKDERQSDRFGKLLNEMLNHTRLPENRGFTNIELSRKNELPPETLEDFAADTNIVPLVKYKDKEKVYPNDPCPCGSGKKYKKCCGKNK